MKIPNPGWPDGPRLKALTAKPVPGAHMVERTHHVSCPSDLHMGMCAIVLTCAHEHRTKEINNPDALCILSLLLKKKKKDD